MTTHLRHLLQLLATAATLAAIAPVAVAMGSGTHAAALRPSATLASAPIALAFTDTTTILWVADSHGGHRRRIARGWQPTLSPNGRLVAATVDNASWALELYTTDGQLVGHYLSGRSQEIAQMAWSPDSRYLAIALEPTTQNGTGELVMLDTRTGALRNVARGFVQGLSFDPARGDRLAFGLLRSRQQYAPGPMDVYVTTASGGAVRQLTHDGRSLNPAYGPRGIAYDRETQRGGGYPAYQVELLAGGSATPLTHTHPSSLVEGLAPVAFSADGTRLVLNYVGEDTLQAWTLDLRTHRLSQLAAGFGALDISRDGSTVLLNQPYYGASGEIATEPFEGGRATRLIANADDASWTR